MKRVYCHSCDRKLCVNPSHLTLDTQGKNMRDVLRRGGRTSTLLPTQVQEIKKLFASGLKLKEIAVRFGVSDSSIRRIVNGKTWKALSLEGEASNF